MRLQNAMQHPQNCAFYHFGCWSDLTSRWLRGVCGHALESLRYSPAVGHRIVEVIISGQSSKVRKSGSHRREPASAPRNISRHEQVQDCSQFRSEILTSTLQLQQDEIWDRTVRVMKEGMQFV